MKKITIGTLATAMLLGSAAFAFAQTTPTPTPAGAKLSCIQAAVDKRETAIGSAFDVFANGSPAVKGMKQAYADRAAALHAAYGITATADRKTAVEKAWTDFRTAKEAARKTFKSSRDRAWATFGTDRQACKAPRQEGAFTESDNL